MRAPGSRPLKGLPQSICQRQIGTGAMKRNFSLSAALRCSYVSTLATAVLGLWIFETDVVAAKQPFSKSAIYVFVIQGVMILNAVILLILFVQDHLRREREKLYKNNVIVWRPPDSEETIDYVTWYDDPAEFNAQELEQLGEALIALAKRNRSTAV